MSQNTYSFTRVTTHSTGKPPKTPIEPYESERFSAYSPVYSSVFRSPLRNSSSTINTASSASKPAASDEKARSSNMATFNTSSSYNRTYEKKVIEEGSPHVRVTTQTHTPVTGGVTIPDLSNLHQSMMSGFPNLAISPNLSTAVSGGGASITSIRVNNTSFHAILDVSKYDQDSLKVTVVDNNVIVEGSHGEKEDTYGTIESTFKRKFSLPKAVPAESVQSQLTADGMLEIDAKAPEPKQESGARPIQIKVINTNSQGPSEQK